MSFNPDAQQTQTEIIGNEGPVSDIDDEGGETKVPPTDADTQEEIDDMIESLYQSLQEYSEEQGMANTLSVEMDNGKIYVQFNETAFFNGDSSVLRDDAKEVLSRVCTIMNGVANAVEEVRVQGHTAQATANDPNDYRKDRTLASERATEVVIFLQYNSELHPARLVSEGYGQWRPVDSNETSETRANNRRVEMIISGRDLDAEALGQSVQTYITRDEMRTGE